MHLIDTTLRDGEQAPGVVFSLDEKITIARMLDAVGVEELELGVPAMGGTHLTDMQAIVETGFSFRTSSWCRGRKSDIDSARLAGTDGVHISFSTSPIHLENLKKSQGDILKELPDIVRYAQDHFPYVSIGAQDASRTNNDFLYQYVDKAQQLGIDRLRIADTVGTMNPETVKTLFMDLSARTSDIILEFHGHNDLGMATANSITALQSGATACSVTVNGLGERAGNAALEEVIMAARYSGILGKEYTTRWLHELSGYVSNVSGRTLHESKPVVGSMVMSHESGIHTYGQLRNKNSYQLFHAEEVGAPKQEFVIGAHSGQASIAYLLKQEGVTASHQECQNIAVLIRKHALMQKRALSIVELLELSQSVLTQYESICV